MRSTYSKKIEHGALWFKDSTTTQCSNLNRGHGNADLKIPVQAEQA